MQLSYSRRRSARVLFLSDRYKKLRLQFAKVHKKVHYSILEKPCLVWWVSISAVTFGWSDRDRIWCKQLESKDPSCFVSGVQASNNGGVMVCGIFLDIHWDRGTNKVMFACCSLPRYYGWPRFSIYNNGTIILVGTLIKRIRVTNQK